MYGFGEAIIIASPNVHDGGLRRRRRTTAFLHAKTPNSKKLWTYSYY